MKTKLAVVSVVTLAALTLGFAASPAAAFHGAWWKGFGTATNSNGLTLNIEFQWGGQDAIITCGGGGCQGSGDGYIALIGTGGVARYPYTGIEDVRNVIFIEDPTWCASVGSMEVTPNYVLDFGTGAISGVQRNCLSTGINKNDFTGTFLDFDLVIHAEGPFGVAHG